MRAEASEWPRAWPLLAFAAFSLLGLVVFRGALHGAFVSDDYGYIVTSPYTSSLSAAHLADILNPRGEARFYTANYAPVHLLATALERQMFADEVIGYHLVNVAVHAANSVLLLALLLSSGVPGAGALLGAALFAVHPANVEAVAWISQLKTAGALALSLGALLAHRRRPGLGALLFALALLTKASAAAALPMAAALTWSRRGGPGGSRRHVAWMLAWAGIALLYLVPEVASFGHFGGVHVPAFEDRWVHLRSVAAVGARYLVMAATSYGVSAFHETPPALSAWDPWWLAALPAGALLAWRCVASLRAGSEEAAWWLLAAASFAPVSQVFPFVNPVADRYLYFILPGLIGGTLLLGLELRRRLWARPGAAGGLRPGGPASRVLALAALLVVLVFAVRSSARAELWHSETRLLLDAARHYPQGGTASFLRARRAAREGDVETALAELRAAERQNACRFTLLLTDPGLAPLRGQPAFQALTEEMAGRWIERMRERGARTQPELRVLAMAHQVRGEIAKAHAVLTRALAAGGLQDALVRRELGALAARLAPSGPGAREAGDPAPGR